MKRFIYILLLMSCLVPFPMHAQIENVIVETYYISDDYDSTDTTGGKLEPGSKTYRVYIDLKPGYTLKKIYGDANHALKISSTADFFNNIADGQSFGKDFSKNRYGENTVGLDSWLTLGQTTRIAAKTYFGVLKTMDSDGSFIGGSNNDGGSDVDNIQRGLLSNTDSDAGIPLTTADGMATMAITPSNWVDYGFLNNGIDSTIFGSVIKGSQFISNNAYLQNSGVAGVIPDSNQILVAQLTTKGEISFELNVEVADSLGNTFKFVANDDTLVAGEQVSPHLKYPQSCGCKDPLYLEYKASYACEDEEACKTRIVLGCMDPLACNFNPQANFSVPSLCCYPGYCNDRDLAVVCPSINNNRSTQPESFNLYPNPAESNITLQIEESEGQEVHYEIYDSFGRVLSSKNMGIVQSKRNEQIEVSHFANGLYIIRLSIGEKSQNKTFIKN